MSNVNEIKTVLENAIVVTPLIAMARVNLDNELKRIETLSNEQILNEATALCNTAKKVIENGGFAFMNASDIPNIALRPLKGESFLFMLKDTKSIKIDTSCTVTKIDKKNTIVQGFQTENVHTITVGIFPSLDNGYNIKNVKVIDGKFDFLDNEYTLASFQPCTTENSIKKLAIVRENLSNKKLLEIVSDNKKALIMNAKSILEKIEKNTQKAIKA